MQFTAHVIVNNEKVKVLARPAKHHICLKLRTSGTDGQFLEDESIFLSEESEHFQSLKAGETISM